jgi:hypothetical protein
VNVVLEQLLTISGRLQVPSEVADNSLGSLREFLAASLIQQNPGALPIEPDSTVDSTVNEAAARGTELATTFATTATRVRVIKDSYVSPALTGERPTHVFGPFVDADGSLVEFGVFESARFLTVQLTLPAPFPLVTEALMLLPAESFSNDGNRTFSIPAGTVWLRARFVVANTAGYIGLRVKQGTLKIDQAAQPRPGRSVGVPTNAHWQLTIEPEQPEEPNGEGSDANAVTVQLPQSFEVLSTGESRVNGTVAIRGFGSDLEFPDAIGAPFANIASVTFPYGAGNAPWSIDGNLSIVAQFTGESRVVSAGWSLPLNKSPLNTFGEAAHGGSLRIKLRDPLESRMVGAAGTFTWFDTAINANTIAFSLDAERAVSSARSELDLWTPAHTEAIFNQQSVTHLRFVSARDGRDVTSVSGGEVRNKWDLPLTAAGKPFAYKGRLDQFAVIAEHTGLLRVTGSAIQQPEINTHGLALENLYLVVRAPRRLGFSGDFDGVSAVAAGFASLFFDVMFAQPSLPDPYVANWNLPDQLFVAESALSISLQWFNSQTPAVNARLERVVRFPESRGALPDEPPELSSRFHGLLDAQPESLYLLDLSTRDHHLGVALPSFAEQRVDLEQNRLTVELRNVRLLMQPQVQWEPFEVVPNPEAGARFSEIVESKSNGARTLAGAASVKLVPVLPRVVCSGIIAAARERSRFAALFSLPFGLRALAFIDPVTELPEGPAVEAGVHQPRFDDLVSARQLRLEATGVLNPDPRKDPAARAMTGAMVQLRNLELGANKLGSVLSGGIDENGVPISGIEDFLNEFQEYLPLHQADLSGYGLSTFSDWHRDVPTGVIKVRFDVLIGRTSYEVIQAKTILAFPMCYAVRTIIMERRNSGKVLRFDSGWQPVNDGEFRVVFQSDPFDPKKNFEFEKGVVKAFRNIRRIRVLSSPALNLSDASRWQPVIFDADAQLENLIAGGGGGLVPILDHPGYIQLAPTGPGSEVTRARIEELLKRIGKPVGGPIDCKIRVGGILETHLSGIFADDAPDDGGLNPALMLAAYGLPKLPRAGQWSAARINGSTSEASPVDPRHGVPIIRRTGQPNYIFREPGDAKRSSPDQFGFLMSTATSRVLFPRPVINPSQPGILTTDKPHVADPYSLVQATSDFPRPTYALRCKETPRFNISADNQWRLTNPNFTFDTPAPDLAKGGEWDMSRGFDPSQRVDVLLDSAIQNKPWEILSTPNDLDINIDGLGKVFTIHTNYSALSGGVPKLDTPTLDFGPVLDAVKDVVSALKNFKGLANFHIDVDVSAGTGPSPSFIVVIKLKFRIGEGPNERIDIGVGKFYGEFTIRGELETGLSGKARGLLSAQFEGDVQQGIIPPVIFAGGFFRFGISITETGKPTIELSLAAVASIGGDLIKNLIEVEVTVRYGYTLIPETLEPGVLLGLEARAKLLGGLVGFSFSVEAMARIKRIAPTANEVIVWAQIRVCATVQVAWLFEEDIDVKTQFEQKIPLSFIAAAAFFPALAPVAAEL